MAATLRQGVGEEDSDTEADEGAAPAGAGWTGHGPPLAVGRWPMQRGLVDGAGLCSPRRWAPQRRFLPTNPTLEEVRWLLNEELGRNTDARLFAALLCGCAEGSPFSVGAVSDLRLKIVNRLAAAGYEAHRRDEDEASPIHFRLLSALLQLCEDPDAMVFKTHAAGVRVGVGVRMPRTPAVCARMRHWRFEGQRETRKFTRGSWPTVALPRRTTSRP